jgi:hypothetical protein
MTTTEFLLRRIEIKEQLVKITKDEIEALMMELAEHHKKSQNREGISCSR